MADNKIDKSNIEYDSINGVPGKYIDKLNGEQLQAVLDANNAAEQSRIDAGKFGDLLGTNTKNASIHIALIICSAMIVLCLLDLLHSFCKDQTLTSEIWQLIFPVVTLSLGYIFGKGESKK